jgi:hypothetical protein
MIGNWIGTAAMSLLLLQAPQIEPPQPGSGRMTPDQEFQIAMEALKRGPAQGLTGVLGVLVPFALFAVIFGIVWLAYRNRQAKMHAQAEFHKQLLEKFGSGREFAEFLESKGSQRFLDAMWSQRSAGNDRILGTMRNGIVMTALGIGTLALSWATEDGLRIPGVLVLALGAGFLISAAVSHRLSKRWEQKPDAEPPPPQLS